MEASRPESGLVDDVLRLSGVRPSADRSIALRTIGDGERGQPHAGDAVRDEADARSRRAKAHEQAFRATAGSGVLTIRFEGTSQPNSPSDSSVALTDHFRLIEGAYRGHGPGRDGPVRLRLDSFGPILDALPPRLADPGNEIIDPSGGPSAPPNGSDPTAPAVVPLPPGGLAGLATLAGFVLIRRARARRTSVRSRLTRDSAGKEGTNR